MEVNNRFDQIVKNMYQRQLKEYERSFGYMTPEERRKLRDWVDEGNSVYENPCLLWREDGRPMDYISAIRFAEDMACDTMQPTSCPPSDIEEGNPF
jgi:hypothetical protein